MSCLHLLNKSPASGLLKELHKALSPGDGLLLLEDGVFYLSRQQELAELPVETSLYFLEPDLRARGLTGALPESARLVDYDAFVDLCASHDKTASWF